MKIVIIGGGASGIVAAIHAKEEENEVIVLEKETDILKKLLKTGNGRCNYYNEDQGLEHYHSSNSDLLKNIITKDHLEKVENFFDSIGIVPKKKNGYYYPNSNQAISMKNALLLKVKELGIQVKTNYFVTRIEKKENQFIITSEDGKLQADKVIISVGSYASFSKTENINGYQLLTELGHKVTPLFPSLVQLKAEGDFLSKWAGIRSEVRLSLYENHRLIKEEEGEIQLTDYGISGICTFNISREVSIGLYNKKQMWVVIDFLKEIPYFEKFLEKRYQLIGNRSCKDFLEGIFHPKLVDVFLENAKIDSFKRYSDLTKEDLQRLRETIKSFPLKIISTNDFSKAQVVAGGIYLDEVNSRTMESLKIKKLYITGEVLDVDGVCGGYNLTFAWLSGILAGRSAKGDSNKTD